MFRAHLAAALLMGTAVLMATDAPANYVDYETGNNFVAYCSHDANKSWKDIALSKYMEGIIASATFNDTKIFCIPPAVTLKQAADIFCNHLNAHPETRHLGVGFLALQSLSEAFPCPK